jgi:RND family efflux transporter MFP subunit
MLFFKTSKTIRRRTIALLTGGLFLGGIGCGRSHPPVPAAAVADAQAAPQAIVSAATRATLTQELVVAAEFYPFQEVDVHAKVAGFLRSIKVDLGDRVGAGQLLATLEVPELNQDLDRATAAKGRYQEEIARAESEIRRYKALFQEYDVTYQRLEAVNRSRPNLVAQQEIDVAKSKRDGAAAQVESAQATLAAARQQLAEAEANEKRARTFTDYGRITAPFAGIVTKRYADSGALVQAGTASNIQAIPVVRIAQINTLRLSFPIPESAIPKVQPGNSVMVRVPALGKTFPARVVRASGNAEAATRTMETQVDVPNPDFELKPGMLASVVITLERRDNALSVPVQAVADPTGAATVLVVRPDNTIETRTVTLGLQTATRYEVLSGLKEGERVVTVGRDRFTAGQSVSPKPAETDHSS